MEEYPLDTTTDKLLVVNSKLRTLTYSYSSGLWHDQMTGYTTTREGADSSSSFTITYDAIGNPTNYFGSELEWSYGRTLNVI